MFSDRQRARATRDRAVRTWLQRIGRRARASSRRWLCWGDSVGFVSSEVIPTLDQGGAAGASAKFTVVEGRAKGRRYKVAQSATIGRSADATIVLEDPEISRLHAKVARNTAGAFEITDLKSRNGTFVNGQRIASARTLAYGDKVRVGPNTLLEYYGFDASEEHLIQRERIEAIGRLSIGIAHDLNNVLAALDAGTSFLRELPPNTVMDQVEIRECLADMSLASVRAAELTRAILSFVRGTSQDHQTVDVSSLTLEVSRMLRHTLDRNIVLVPVVLPGLYVQGNRSELHQALLNLCLNARDAMPTGGTLTLRAEPLAQARAGSSSPNAPAMVVVSVRDTGVGMDAATQARIFEPFFTTKREGRGYGLGLATVREIATVHGGEIHVESGIGAGTEFALLLPSASRPASALVDAEPGEPNVTLRPPATYTVMLVDDEEIVRRSVARRLRQVGLDVIEANGGQAALRLLQLHDVDLILLDIDMPELDGEQTFGRLRKLKPGVRVAFMSGYTDPTRAVRLKAQGAMAMLDKPCSLDDILTLIQRATTDPGAPNEEDFESLTRPL